MYLQIYIYFFLGSMANCTMDDTIANQFDDVSTSLQVEQLNEAKVYDIKNDDNFIDEPTALSDISMCLDAPKTSDSDFVENLLFDMKPDEFNSINSNDKTIVQPSNSDTSTSDCNTKLYNSELNDKNQMMFFPSISKINFSNETQLFSSTDETTCSDINNTCTIVKKRGFSIEEISKDETSQNSQSLNTYSNDYTCFLSEQTDAISNLTPFKRNNSYYFDSPVKKLCTSKPADEVKTNELFNDTLFSNDKDNKPYSGFTSIQNDLEVDCIQDRYDGSDSGFGSELAEDKNNTNVDVAVSTSNLSYKNDFTLNQNSSFEDLQRTSNEFLSAMEVLKPKFADSLQDTCSLGVSNNYGIVKGILKRKSINYGLSTTDELTTVKKKKNINFSNVTVFYFPRIQGFTCVPSQVRNFEFINI